jgi:hypothetical protein
MAKKQNTKQAETKKLTPPNWYKDKKDRAPKPGKGKIGKPEATAAKAEKPIARPGSNVAKAIAMMSTGKAVTMAEITKKIRCKTMYNPLGKLVKRGLLVKTEKGYLLPKPRK